MRGWKRKKTNPSNYGAFKYCQMRDGPVCHDMGIVLLKIKVEVVVLVTMG